MESLLHEISDARNRNRVSNTSGTLIYSTDMGMLHVKSIPDPT